MPKELLNKIYIESGQAGYNGKNEHIEKAMEHFAVGDKTHVFLIDDDWINVSRAKITGVNTVIVEKEDNSYLSEIHKIIASHQASNDIINDKSANIFTVNTVNPYEKLQLTKINQDDIDLQGVDNENN